MENVNRSRREIGLDLNDTQMSLGIGRRVLSETLRQKPVRPEEVAIARRAVLDSRLARNALRRELLDIKRSENLTGSELPIW